MLNRGDQFGYKTIIQDEERRTASCIALTACDLIVIKK
jgi:CRP-like cAMP-binding protein